MTLKNVFLILLFIFQILCIDATKYTYTNTQPCEDCEEKSKIFYQMENTKLCPRCTLGYLNFWFQPMYLQENDRYLKSRITQEDELKSIKFYMTDIIFDLLNGNNQPQHITWVSTNQLVGEKLKIRFQMLENCKNYDEKETKPNLVFISNTILYENPHFFNLLMEEKHCKGCTANVFYRIKTFCCGEFICPNCLAGDKIKSGKCMICKKHLYQNKKEFGHLIKCLCLIHWKGERVETKDKEKMLENTIEKLNMPSKKSKENTLGTEAAKIIWPDIGSKTPKYSFSSKKTIFQTLPCFFQYLVADRYDFYFWLWNADKFQMFDYQQYSILSVYKSIFKCKKK